jgi:hypothetical protein
MKKIVLTAAALLAISGSAFALSCEDPRWSAESWTAVVWTCAASIRKSGPGAQTPAQGSDRNLFGNH